MTDGVRRARMVGVSGESAGMAACQEDADRRPPAHQASGEVLAMHSDFGVQRIGEQFVTAVSFNRWQRRVQQADLQHGPTVCTVWIGIFGGSFGSWHSAKQKRSVTAAAGGT